MSLDDPSPFARKSALPRSPVNRPLPTPPTEIDTINDPLSVPTSPDEPTPRATPTLEPSERRLDDGPESTTDTSAPVESVAPVIRKPSIKKRPILKKVDSGSTPSVSSSSSTLTVDESSRGNGGDITPEFEVVRSTNTRPNTAGPTVSSTTSSSTTSSSAFSKLPPKSGTLKKSESKTKGKAGGSDDVFAPVYSYEDSLTQLVAHEGIGEETCNLITSKKWNETVDGLQKLQTQIIALPLDQIQSILPAVFYFLLKTPSFKPSNVQVTKQVFEAVKQFSTLLTPFPSSLLTCTFTDLFNKISDKKFQEMIYDVLLSFCEAVGPKIILTEWIKIINNEVKNIKSIESAILFIPKLLDEFGCASIDVNMVIKEAHIWIQHIQKGIRDGAISILVEIYKQTGSMLKELLLNDVKNNLVKSTIETEFSTIGTVNPAVYEPKRFVRGGSTSAGKINLDDVIPRTDISEKMTEELIAKLNDDAWKSRKEAMEEIHAILVQANHRISGKDGGLIDSLKLRLVDNNKNLAKDAIVLLSTLITDMGSPILKFSSKIVPPLLNAVGDSKTFVKAEAVKALDQWVDLSGLQALIKYLPKTLDVASPSRQEILNLLVTRLPIGPTKLDGAISKFDLSELVMPVLNLLLDKSPDVRSSSEKVLEFVVGNVSYDRVVEETKAMKKAMVLQIMPIMEKYRYTSLGTSHQNKSTSSDAASSASTNTANSAPSPTLGLDDDYSARPMTAPARKAGTLKKATSGAVTSREPATASTATSGAPSTATEKPSMLKARSRQSTLPQGFKKPTTAPTEVEPIESVEESSAASSGSSLLKKIDLPAKRTRVAKDAKRVKGLYREFSKDEIEELDQCMYLLFSDDIYAMLFHKDFQKQVAALDAVDRELEQNYDAIASISDLLLKWCSWRMMDANTTVLAKILPLIEKLFQAFERNNYKLTEGEAANIFPSLVEKAFGHNTTRFRSDTKAILDLSAAIFPVVKLVTFVIQGFESKNKRVEIECMEYIGLLLAKHGLQLCDAKKLLPQIGVMVGVNDAGVRTAALNALSSIYAVIGDELWVLLGRGSTKEQKIPEKQMAMIEERMKRIKTTGVGVNGVPLAWNEDGTVPNTTTAAVPIASTSSSSSVSSIPIPTSASGTPRKSIAPVGASSLLARKKSAIGLPKAGGGGRAATMRPNQFAAAKAEYDAMTAAESAASHQMHEEHHVEREATPPNSSDEPPPPSKVLTHTPVKPTHGRFHSNVAEYVNPATGSNLPGCFSLELDPLIASHRSGFEDSDALLTESIPSAAASNGSSLPPASPHLQQIPSFHNTHTEPSIAGGVAQSAFLSDTLIVLMEPSIPAAERVEALQRMTQLLAVQGPTAIESNEETLITVLMYELGNSYVVYPATGLVKMNSAWNSASISAISELVSSREMMAAIPIELVEQLLEFLFALLADQRMLRSPSCTNLIKSCNELILKALDHSPRTRAFTMTINLLRGAMLDPTREGQIVLIAKCVSKLHSALLRIGAANLDLTELLDALKAFLDVISPTDTKHNNEAIKALLSIVHELVHLRESDLRSCVTSLPSECMLSQYLQQLLEAAEEERLESQQAALTSPHSSANVRSVHSSPVIQAAAPLPIISTPSRVRLGSNAGGTIPSGSNPSPAGSPSAYREQLEHLKLKAASLSSPSMNAQPTPSQTQSTLPAPTFPPLDDMPLSPSSTQNSNQPKQQSSLEAIRARFKTLKPTTTATGASSNQEQENKNIQPTVGNSGPPSLLMKPQPLLAHISLTDSTNTQPPATAAPIPPTTTTGSSSLLALRAKVATMNKKTVSSMNSAPTQQPWFDATRLQKQTGLDENRLRVKLIGSFDTIWSRYQKPIITSSNSVVGKPLLGSQRSGYGRPSPPNYSSINSTSAAAYSAIRSNSAATMSNIHGFHNLSNPQPQRGGQQSQPSRYGQTLPTPAGMVVAPEETGVSMMAPKPSPDGMQPTLSERLCPGITWFSMVTVISIIDVILFIITLIVGASKYGGAFDSSNKMGGPNAITLCIMGGKWEPAIRSGDVWRLFTQILLHAGIMHILSNLFFQLRFGYVTELRWGSWRWLAVYFLGGIMASLWSTEFGPKNVSVGASGALFAIVGADFTYLAYNWAQIPHNRQEVFLLVIVTVITFLFGMSGNIDNWAHLGGLIGGLFLGICIPPHLVERDTELYIKLGAGGLFAILNLIFFLTIFVGNPWPDWPDYWSTSCTAGTSY